MTIIDDAPRVISDTADATDSGVPFRDLGLPDSIVHRLESQGKHTASPSRPPSSPTPSRAATSPAAPRPAPARPSASACRSSPV